MDFVEDAWEVFQACLAYTLTTVVLVLAIVFVVAIVEDHPIRGYYLDISNGRPAIYADVDWMPDFTVREIPGVPHDAAVEMVNELNAGVAK